MNYEAAQCRWSNEELEAIRTEVPEVGKPLILAVRHRQEYSRANCTFSPPLDTNILYQVVEGEVTDQTGEVVEGVEAWDDGGDLSVCGIRFSGPVSSALIDKRLMKDPGDAGLSRGGAGRTQLRAVDNNTQLRSRWHPRPGPSEQDPGRDPHQGRQLPPAAVPGLFWVPAGPLPAEHRAGTSHGKSDHQLQRGGGCEEHKY